ncbi:DUF6928 family protein [Actinomadura napierensis]|uniref:Uncharacterized protein n=1 Tax=Actinomadura napierensis TaxID=267854 RepID=A0ABP5JXD4_9ACTN
MGAKTAVLIYTDGHPADLLCSATEPDLPATTALISRTNPGWDGSTASSGDLQDYFCPDQGIAYAGSFPGIDVLCDRQVMVDRPSHLPAHLLHASAYRGRVILHAVHSVTDWFAYAIWENGTLLRSLSLSPDSGVIESIGTPLGVRTALLGRRTPPPRPFPASQTRSPTLCPSTPGAGR